MSRINVDFTAVADNDGRFGRLAQLLGLADADHARGKVEHLWVACTTRGETALPRWLVEKHLGELGPEAMISAELARWSRGRGDSKTRTLYICGAEKRCLWLRINQEQSSKGGKANAANASRVAGRFTSRVDGDATSPPAPAPAPSPKEEEEEPPLSDSPRTRAEEIAELAISEINRLAKSHYLPASESARDLAKGLAKRKRTNEEILLVIRSKANWVSDPVMAEHFCPATLLGPKNFTKYLDAARATAQPRGPLRIVPADDEPPLGIDLHLRPESA